MQNSSLENVTPEQELSSESVAEVPTSSPVIANTFVGGCAVNKEYAMKAIKRLKSLLKTSNKINEMGINLLEYETPFVNLIEESVAVVLCRNNEKIFELILNDIQWWLYENVEKVIIYKDKKMDVSTAEKFVNWLSDHYNSEAVTA